MESNDRDELDSLVDDAISSYAPEPRTGIESRILHRVRVEGSRRSFAWVPFALGFSALLLLAFLFRVRQPVPAGTPSRSAASLGHVAIVSAAVSVAKRPRLEHKSRAVSRFDQFPAPSPLTREEKALVRFVSSYPEETREIAAEQNEPLPVPIEIPQIQILPLSTGGGF